MNDNYERMKRLVNENIGEIPQNITLEWIKEKYNDNNSWFNLWFFTYSDLRGHTFDNNITSDMKRHINFSTKTLMDSEFFKVTDSMYKVDKAIEQLHAKGIEGQNMEVAVIDYSFETLHNEIKEELVSYTNLSDNRPHYHGTVVSSLLCGKNIGVAPKAKLHFYGISQGVPTEEKQINDVIKSLEDIYEKNKNGANIRIVNLSSSMHRKNEEFFELSNKLKEQGCYVIDSIDFHKYYTPINIDPNTNEYYYGIWQNKELDKIKSLIGIPTGSMIPLHETQDDYQYCGDASVSWSIPVLSGLFTLALQIKNNLTFDEFNEIIINNKKTYEDGKIIIDIERTFSLIEKMNNNKTI